MQTRLVFAETVTYVICTLYVNGYDIHKEMASVYNMICNHDYWRSELVQGGPLFKVKAPLCVLKAN